MFEKIQFNSIRWFNLKNLKNEKWKNIKGYEESYQVSNYGRIKSLFRKIEYRVYKEKIMKLEEHSDGYLRVDLYKNNKKKHKKVHRLVAETFLDNKDNLPCINHKDENRHNNIISNLEFCTYSYNINYGNRNIKTAIKHYKKINQFTLNNEFIKTWDSMKEIKETLKIDPSSCCRGKSKSAGGFIFKYQSDFTK